MGPHGIQFGAFFVISTAIRMQFANPLAIYPLGFFIKIP